MELSDLRYLVTIAREGSISAAAARLGMSQPNLSRQISSLERELGATLLIRGNRRVELTEEGRALLKRAEQILELAELARAEVEVAEESLGGTVRIAGGEVDAMRLLSRAAVELRRDHPAVDFSVISGNSLQVTEMLDRGLADFGVLVGTADRSRYDHIRLPVAARWGLMVREDHPLAGRDTVRPRDLSGVPLIVSAQSHDGNELSGWMGPSSRTEVAARYNLLYNASLMVSEGLGCALCLEGIVNTCGTDLRFVPLEPPVESEVILVWPRGWMMSREARAFLEVLRRIIEPAGNAPAGVVRPAWGESRR